MAKYGNEKTPKNTTDTCNTCTNSIIDNFFNYKSMDTMKTVKKQKTTSQVITCRIPVHQWHELEYYCTENNHTMSKVLRSGINNFLNDQRETTFVSTK